MTYSITSPSDLKIKDNDKIYYGGDQEWFPRFRQRLSGCGTTVASDMLVYKTGINKAHNLNKNEMLNFMVNVWDYVTPTLMGIFNAKMLITGLERYCNHNDLNYSFNRINYPFIKSARPNVKKVIDFIVDGLKNDSPIAFVNLSAEGTENLSDWHWVLITSVTVGTDEITAEIYDSGTRQVINLSGWLAHTKKGGGFVSINK